MASVKENDSEYLDIFILKTK